MSLRIALLSYRGNPRSGGQGVYVRHLSRELVALGHRVEVLAGPPYPVLDPGVRLTRIPSLDLFAEPNPFRRAALRELRALPDWAEYLAMRTGGFGEPLAFSLRVSWELRRRRREFDVVHDNQGLGYGMLATGLPVLATVHHPISIDRELKLAAAGSGARREVERWYRFLAMQHRVARRLPRILTVSNASREAIIARMGVRPDRIETVPLAADTRVFRPRAGKVAGRIVTIASADEPLKGLAHLLSAMPSIPGAELVVVGVANQGGATARLAGRLGTSVRFVNGLTETELAELVAGAEVACVPSLYEGFSLPAVEAMASGTALVATTAGALPEVAGDAALLCPPGDPAALAARIRQVLGDPGLRGELVAAGVARAATMSWERTARETARQYGLLAEDVTGGVLTC